MVIPRVLTCSIDIKLGVFPEGTSIFETAKALRDYFAKEAQFEVVAIQQCPNHIARVTFEEGGEAAKADFQDKGSIRIFGVECEVISPAPPVEKVLVYNFPYENNDAPVHRALSEYGEVEGISYQMWVGLPGIHTGTRLVKMVRSSTIPRSLVIAGFAVRSGTGASRSLAIRAGRRVTLLPSALTRVDVFTAGSRGILPVTALIVRVSMVGVPGVRCPIVVSLVLSWVSPLVVGPRQLRLFVLSSFLWVGLLCRWGMSLRARLSYGVLPLPPLRGMSRMAGALPLLSPM